MIRDQIVVQRRTRMAVLRSMICWPLMPFHLIPDCFMRWLNMTLHPASINSASFGFACLPAFREIHVLAVLLQIADRRRMVFVRSLQIVASFLLGCSRNHLLNAIGLVMHCSEV